MRHIRYCSMAKNISCRNSLIVTTGQCSTLLSSSHYLVAGRLEYHEWICLGLDPSSSHLGWIVHSTPRLGSRSLSLRYRRLPWSADGPMHLERILVQDDFTNRSEEAPHSYTDLLEVFRRRMSESVKGRASFSLPVPCPNRLVIGGQPPATAH